MNFKFNNKYLETLSLLFRIKHLYIFIAIFKYYLNVPSEHYELALAFCMVQGEENKRRRRTSRLPSENKPPVKTENIQQKQKEETKDNQTNQIEKLEKENEISNLCGSNETRKSVPLEETVPSRTQSSKGTSLDKDLGKSILLEPPFTNTIMQIQRNANAVQKPQEPGIKKSSIRRISKSSSEQLGLQILKTSQTEESQTSNVRQAQYVLNILNQQKNIPKIEPALNLTFKEGEKSTIREKPEVKEIIKVPKEPKVPKKTKKKQVEENSIESNVTIEQNIAIETAKPKISKIGILKGLKKS